MRTTGIRCAVSVLVCALALTGCFASPGGQAGGNRLSVGLAFPPAAEMSPYSDDALLLSKLGALETLAVLDGDGVARPALAERWERTGPTTLRVTLRPGVTFHDGTPLTAEHAATALNHAARATVAPRALSGVELLAAATGELTLDVSTAKPDPILEQRLTAPELAILGPSAYAEDPGAPDPVRAGTGPYVLESVQGSASAALSANPGYWGGAPASSGIDVRFIPDGGSRAGALRAGEVDVIDAVPVSQLPTTTGQEVLEFPLPRLVGAHLNTKKGTFTDPALRAAAREAIDPAEIAEGIYTGQADPARGLFGPASPWAASGPQRRETLPAEPHGQPVRVATYDERPELPEIASVVADKLRAAGFRVEDVVVQEYSTMESDLLDGAYDVVVGARSYSVDTGDPISYLGTDWTCAGSYNLSLLCDGSIDSAVAEASGLGMDQRGAAAVSIAAQVLGTDAIVPLVHERTRIGIAPGVRGVAEDGFERRLITAETVPGA